MVSLETGIILLAFGLPWAVFKGYAVWRIAHDIRRGGSAPTLDFPVLCPIPLSLGLCFVLAWPGRPPFPGFGFVTWFVTYLGLATLFGFLLWLFRRLGEPEQQRQAKNIQEKGGQSIPMKSFWRIGAFLNGVLIAYVLGADFFIIELPARQGKELDFGDALELMAFHWPALILCSLINCSWVYRSFWEIWQGRNYRSLIALVASFGAWGIVYWTIFRIQ